MRLGLLAYLIITFVVFDLNSTAYSEVDGSANGQGAEHGGVLDGYRASAFCYIELLYLLENTGTRTCFTEPYYTQRPIRYSVGINGTMRNIARVITIWVSCCLEALQF